MTLPYSAIAIRGVGMGAMMYFMHIKKLQIW